eukprot:6184115-Pleurochrysis_carterae.AAC.1
MGAALETEADEAARLALESKGRLGEKSLRSTSVARPSELVQHPRARGADACALVPDSGGDPVSEQDERKGDCWRDPACNGRGDAAARISRCGACACATAPIWAAMYAGCCTALDSGGAALLRTGSVTGWFENSVVGCELAVSAGTMACSAGIGAGVRAGTAAPSEVHGAGASLGDVGDATKEAVDVLIKGAGAEVGSATCEDARVAAAGCGRAAGDACRGSRASACWYACWRACGSAEERGCGSAEERGCEGVCKEGCEGECEAGCEGGRRDVSEDGGGSGCGDGCSPTSVAPSVGSSRRTARTWLRRAVVTTWPSAGRLGGRAGVAAAVAKAAAAISARLVSAVAAWLEAAAGAASTGIAAAWAVGATGMTAGTQAEAAAEAALHAGEEAGGGAMSGWVCAMLAEGKRALAITSEGRHAEGARQSLLCGESVLRRPSSRGDGAICVGDGASCVGDGAICVGDGAICVGDGAICVGDGAICVVDNAERRVAGVAQPCQASGDRRHSRWQP